ncbi:MAG TPA: HisA/HisF-related TIM barrel protein [Gemmatimonadales bacterium]|nr:HisA/HisF-related TIM barrel protein [Gemmatimonadales bacterium]
MELYPAVDVQGGRVARAPAGEGGGTDPLAALARFARAGVRWVHFVDLDRAFGRGANRDLARAFLAAAPPTVRVQVGGGLASEEAIDELIAWGAARVVVGTAAAADAALVDRLLARHGADRLAVGIDAKNGRLAPRGAAAPLPPSPLTPASLARRVQAQGARTLVYADAARDGTLAGPDVAGARALVQVGLDVIVSGGVGSLDDLRAVRAAGLAGAVVGRALYAGTFTVAEALACVA